MENILDFVKDKKQKISAKISNKKIKVLLKKRRKGFSLMEVIIAVVIVAIISTMAAVNCFKAQQRAKKNIDYATAANIATAAQMAVMDGESNVTIDSLVSGGYLQSTPKVQQGSGGSFTIQVGDKDNITVKIGTETYYPKTDTGN